MGTSLHADCVHKSRLNLIRNILQQLFHVLHANYIPGIINTDVDRTALGIGKTTHPLQVFVPPGFLIFYILTFRHCHLL